jgi:lipid kinase, YegS/Rv2252/BmrU family
MYNFIVNTASRTGEGIIAWNKIEALLEETQIPYKVYFTKYHHHATNITKTLSSSNLPITIIGVGGDGTINEIINGIVNHELTTLGFIPIGSGNDFARGFPIPFELSEAIDCAILPKRISNIDIGNIIYKDGSRAFGNSMGMGFDAAVCLEANSTSIKHILNRLHLGKLTYIGMALKQLFLLKTAHITLTLEDNEVHEFKKCYFVTIMNQQFEGGGFKFCPDAKNDDGYLDICVVDNIIKAKIALIFPSAFKGKHVKIKGIHIFRCKKAHLVADRPLAVHADGESCDFHKELTVELAPEKIRILATS